MSNIRLIDGLNCGVPSRQLLHVLAPKLIEPATRGTCFVRYANGQVIPFVLQHKPEVKVSGTREMPSLFRY